jgi:Carboxypeptidase regulatory-like domain
LLCLTAAVAYAQISQATLEGTVKDNTGAVIPGAAVTLKNKGTTAARAAVSDASGQYSIPNVDPAEYSLTVSFKGFKTFVISTLTLHTGERSTVDGILEVGDATQQVTVEAAVPLLSATSTEVSHLVPPAQVAELPLNGRNFWELTQLTPGATFVPRGQVSQYNGSEIRPATST